MGDGPRQYTAVFACEAAEGLGFAAPLLAIAAELRRLVAQHGCRLRTAFVLSDPVYCGHEVALQGHGVVPAPPNRQSLAIDSRGKSYANILAAHGFAHERELK